MYGQTIYGGLYWGGLDVWSDHTVDCTGGLDVWSDHLRWTVLGGLDVWPDHLRWTVLGGARCMVRPSTVDCTGGGLDVWSDHLRWTVLGGG